MASSPADLIRIRSQVGAALSDFLGRQRDDLARIGTDLVPCVDAITDLLAGGKRLRPAFCYWGWRACGGTDEPAIFAAAASLELLHASALVHDDVMDASDTRRGQPSVHKRFAATHASAGWRGAPDSFGAGAAILVGDLLLAWTDEMLRKSGLSPAAIQHGMLVLDAMRTEVFAGQFLDLIGQASAISSIDNALRVITYKSAKYTVERPLQLGAALATADTRQAAPAAFTEYGIPLGIAFQLRDDILGVFGDPAMTGKPVNDDLREGKRTVMLAIARERAAQAQAQVLDRCVGDPALSGSAAEEVRAVITGTGALAECELMIEHNLKAALSALESAPITAEAKSALAELAVAATSRAD
ncbi:MAG TPA: polyprenyl synthetase family protein [Streptosporangiaceae bacterium]|nr:polyprenyl synthetase family protein [Streptosporangiaceae bacterium]